MEYFVAYADYVGYFGSALIFCAFYMKTMIPLRAVAIASNITMITFGFFGKVYPMLILHSCLLPLNITMLIQMKTLIKNVKEASNGEFNMEWLLPYMKKETYTKGDYIFKIQEKAEHLFFLQKGKILLPEINREMNEGSLIGEIGIFSPHQKRTASAKCLNDVIVYSIPYNKVLELYYQNPKFGFLLIELINKRLLRDEQKCNQGA